MKTYYLIDFENVGNEGMNGCESLTSNDRIYLFYTENVKSIDVNIIGNHGSAKFYVLKVPVGKQSTDMHLVSFLGYLIGMNKDSESKYVIVSKDTDYDNVIKFWKEKKKLSVSRAEKITGAKKKSNNKNNVDNQGQKTDVQTQNVSDTKKDSAEKTKKSQLNNEIQQELKKDKVSAEVTGFVTSNVLKHIGQKNNKNTVYRIFVDKYGQAQGLDLYKRIKKYL